MQLILNLNGIIKRHKVYITNFIRSHSNKPYEDPENAYKKAVVLTKTIIDFITDPSNGIAAMNGRYVIYTNSGNSLYTDCICICCDRTLMKLKNYGTNKEESKNLCFDQLPETSASVSSLRSYITDMIIFAIKMGVDDKVIAKWKRKIRKI